ncbi:MAG: dihydrofolate reductase [Bacteroidales bacterium]|jgi:dihydrofolate reductase|nr:dihydrofolate reductase [Bacteroidales bacterium]
MLALIAAIDEQRGIGLRNGLLVRLPADMQYFKRLTLGHTVVMGRHTYESLPVKPLPNRRNIVVSATLPAAEGCKIAASVDEALKLCTGSEKSFVIGGMQLYEAMMPYASQLYITRIRHCFEADAFFPVIDSDMWALQSSEPHEQDERHPCAYIFEVYERTGNLS